MVSVIIATYRREELLKRAIVSVICQTYSDIEIVLVDDNANENWNSKVVNVIREFKNIRYICNKSNQGSAETRNIGIKAANGEYITFLDDDDIYLPGKIKHQVEEMIAHSADYSITDLFLYNENGNLINKRVRSYIKNTTPGELLKCHLMYHLTGTDSMMFRKDYLIKIGGFPPINVGDEFYLMKEAITGYGKFIYIPGCYIKAYVHTGENKGLSSGDRKIRGENQLYEYKKTLFNMIDVKNRRYIHMRHYAVLAFAEMRRKRYGSFLKNAFCAFIFAPVSSVKLLIEWSN